MIHSKIRGAIQRVGRLSTSLRQQRKQDVDARDEPGHDETVTQDDAASFRAGSAAVITNPSYPFAATSLQIWR
jgi:hypothetical protein